MLELIFGTYGVLCWLVFKKFKLVPVNTYTVCTAILGAIVMMLMLLILLSMFHPATKDGRLYTVTTPIIPTVKGRVIEVIPEGRALKQGDVLFQIDPAPYQYEVDALEAALAAANANAAQLEERLHAAESMTKQARARLLSTESDYDRQVREEVSQAKSEVARVSGELELAKTQLDRYEELIKEKVVAQVEYDRVKERFNDVESRLAKAQGAQRQAEEKLRSGGDKMTSATEEINRAEAQEREARVAFEAESGGLNPEVRQIIAQLDNKRWELEQTTVRAPANGYTTQVALRPGQFVTPNLFAAVMVFVHEEKPMLVASLPQNVIANIKPGLEAELAFKSYPGRIYKATVKRIMPTTAEGQFEASGDLRTLTSSRAKGRIPVVFEYDEDVVALNLPGGSQAIVAVYTERVHALAIMRKILLRIKSWENYIFAP